MSHLTLGNVAIDVEGYRVRVDLRLVPLTFTEFELLLRLARKPGKVITREELLRSVWDGRSLAGKDTLTVHISRLRKKMCESQPWGIRTIRRRGYVLADCA